MNILLRKPLLLFLLALFAAIGLAPPPSSAETVDLSQIAPKANKSKKVSHLIYQVKEANQSKSLSTNAIWDTYRAQVIGDSIQLEVVLTREVDDEVLGYLAHSAGRVQRQHERSVQMIVPLGAIDWFESRPVVAGVYLPNYALPQSVISEGLDTLGVLQFQSKGYRGQGVKVAVIDGSFKNYLNYAGSDLPAIIHTKQFGLSFEGSSEHGTQCAQIIYDVAPEAEIWLIQIDTYSDILDACDWIKDNAFDVVSVSLAFLNSGWLDGSSSLSKKVEEVRNRGVLWVNSAGNYAEQHWWGRFYDSDGNGFHEFGYLDEGNTISLEEGWPVSFYLTWNDWPYSSNDYDLYLVYSSTGTIVASSMNLQNGLQSPVEAISITVPVTGNYHLAVKRYSTIGNHWFQLFAPGLSGMQYSKSSYSVPIPGDSKGALTVGAVPWYNTGQIESFSSIGPTEDFRTKPELVAPDRVTVKTVSGTTDNTPGTSYACPHVAGAAAVYLSAKPSVYPPAVTDSFKTMCIDRGPSGADNTYGWGLLHIKIRNSAPTLTNPGNKTVNENSVLAFTLAATDPDLDQLTYSAVQLPSGATLSSTDGYFSWQPTYDQAGTTVLHLQFQIGRQSTRSQL
jgi:subtilisin family serine protease